uniref:Uncharacterized protein n=1 Tax=Myoviridae sp. ct8iP21 TaxID=2825041 RepID=A0A8S5V420_9CAUD|nr:MAG TPA: hypothetical protein [Myoviridae sp. ct8iP21]
MIFGILNHIGDFTAMVNKKSQPIQDQPQDDTIIINRN